MRNWILEATNQDMPKIAGSLSKLRKEAGNPFQRLLEEPPWQTPHFCLCKNKLLDESVILIMSEKSDPEFSPRLEIRERERLSLQKNVFKLREHLHLYLKAKSDIQFNHEWKS